MRKAGMTNENYGMFSAAQEMFLTSLGGFATWREENRYDFLRVVCVPRAPYRVEGRLCGDTYRFPVSPRDGEVALFRVRMI